MSTGLDPWTRRQSDESNCVVYQLTSRGVERAVTGHLDERRDTGDYGHWRLRALWSGGTQDHERKGRTRTGRRRVGGLHSLDVPLDP